MDYNVKIIGLFHLVELTFKDGILLDGYFKPGADNPDQEPWLIAEIGCGGLTISVAVNNKGSSYNLLPGAADYRLIDSPKPEVGGLLKEAIEKWIV